jgi:hypothetical protein
VVERAPDSMGFIDESTVGGPRRALRLSDRRSLYIASVALRGADDQRPGLGAVLVGTGHSRERASLVVPPECDLVLRTSLLRLCGSRTISSPAGPMPWEVIALREFCHPYEGLFRKICVSGRGAFVCADLGWTVSLLAERWTPARGAFAGGWTFWPWDWSEENVRRDGRTVLRSVSPHVGPIRMVAAGEMGYRAELGAAPGGRRAGKRNPDGTRWRGWFVDLIPAAFSFDGIERRDLAEHFAAFGLPALELPTALPLDDEAANQLMDVVENMHALAMILDGQAARFFTSARDRARGVSRVDLATVRPGRLAGELLDALGIVPPRVKFADVSPGLLDAYQGAAHGGWLSDEGAR